MGKWVVLVCAFYSMITGPELYSHHPFLSTLQQSDADEKPEAISLLGKRLFAKPVAEKSELENYQREMEEAEKKFKTDPKNPDVVMQYGNSLARLWRYRDAIDVFSYGIEWFPEYAKLYRYRGHRYISIREFDKAVDDLKLASQLNDSDYEIWYHLALALYLEGDFAAAEKAYRECTRFVVEDESLVAVSNWLYITLRRQGKEEEAASVLAGIQEKMQVVEAGPYLNLLLFYQGKRSEAEARELASESALNRVTIIYGLGCWHLYSGDPAGAEEYFKEAVSGAYWPAFGFIAAEVELARAAN